MYSRGGNAEFCKGGDAVANVGATGDICVEEFTEEAAVAETKGFGKGSMFRGAFFVARSGGVHLIEVAFSERWLRLGVGFRFMGRRFLPVMGFEEATDVGCSRQFDVV